MKHKKGLNAIVIENGDHFFGFIKEFPAAAASAESIKDLFDKLKIAVSEVVKHEMIDYQFEKLAK